MEKKLERIFISQEEEKYIVISGSKNYWTGHNLRKNKELLKTYIWGLLAGYHFNIPFDNIDNGIPFYPEWSYVGGEALERTEFEQLIEELKGPDGELYV